MNSALFAIILIVICLVWIVIWYRMLNAPVVLRFEINDGKTEISFSNGTISAENLKTLESFFIHSFKVVNGVVVQNQIDGDPPSSSGVGSASLGEEGGAVSFENNVGVFGENEHASWESEMENQTVGEMKSDAQVDQEGKEENQEVVFFGNGDDSERDHEDESEQYGGEPQYDDSDQEDQDNQTYQREFKKHLNESYQEFEAFEQKNLEDSEKITDDVEDQQEFQNDQEEPPSNAIRITNENKK